MGKVLVSIDDWLLARVDKEARRLGLSRSAYIARIAAEDVGARPGPGRHQRVKRALGKLDRLFDRNGYREDSTTAIRRERDAR